MGGKRHCRYITLDGGPPHDPRPAFLLVLPVKGPFLGAKVFLRATVGVYVCRYAVCGGGHSMDSYGPLGSVRDVHAGAALALRSRF